MGAMARKFLAGAALCFVLAAASCVSGMAAQAEAAPKAAGGTGGGGGVSDIQDRDWILTEMIVNFAAVGIDRTTPANLPLGMGESFTLRFDAERVSGVGLPNRFFASYATTEGNGLSISAIAATLMAPLFEIEGITEHEYFAYLANVKSWDIRDGKLELFTSGADGEAVVLIYQ